MRPALREMPQLRAQFLQLFRVVGAVFGQLLDGRLLGLVGLVVGESGSVWVWLGAKIYTWERQMEGNIKRRHESHAEQDTNEAFVGMRE